MPAGLPRGGDDGVDVERLDRRHGEHPGRDALGGELLGGDQRPPEHGAVADQGHVVALAQGDRLAGDEGVVLGVDLRARPSGSPG